HVRVGRCRQCRRRVQGRHPLQTTDSLGAASTHLGPQAVTLIVLLNKPNWRAEQALRPAVVNRKVSGGNRSPRGAETQQILTSVIQTARVRDLDPRDVLVDLLRAPCRSCPRRSPLSIRL